MAKVKLPKFFAAVDDSTEAEVFKKIDKIASVNGYYGIKINLDLVIKDFSVIGRVAQKTNKPIFVDLKLWNGKRTMRETITEVANNGAAMVNVWALADSMLEDAVKVAEEKGLTILGITVLTHYNNDYCRKFHNMDMPDLVRLLAETSLRWGCDGYILPGTMLDAVSDLGGIKFNPAVRPEWFADKKANFQEQEFQPGEAIRRGSHIVSCGSPVFKSPDPAEALSKILKEVYST